MQIAATACLVVAIFDRLSLCHDAPPLACFFCFSVASLCFLVCCLIDFGRDGRNTLLRFWAPTEQYMALGFGMASPFATDAAVRALMGVLCDGIPAGMWGEFVYLPGITSSGLIRPV